MSLPIVDIPNMPSDKGQPSEKTVEIIESLFAQFAGFKKSANLRNKIKRVIGGKSDAELMEWVNYMVSQRGKGELMALAEDLTNHETFFFRDPLQLDCLENDILPALVKQKKKSGDKVIRIWSAACATGEEAYTLAMVAVKYMQKQNMLHISDTGYIHFKDGWEIKVFGTDISQQVVAMAKNAMYSDAGLSSFRSFPEENFRFMVFLGETEDRLYHVNTRNYQIHPAIRKLVTFDVHNLNDPQLPLYLKNMDVIFARNLMIYLDLDSQKRILSKFSAALNKKAFLVLSVVDKMLLPEQFSESRFGRNIVYQRR